MLTPRRADIDAECARRLQKTDLRRLAAGLLGRRRRELGGAGRGECPTEKAQNRVLPVRREGVVAVFEVELAERRPDANGTHPILGQRAGLVRADDGRGTERLDRGKPADESSTSCERRHADREREGDRRQEPLGDVGDDEPDREDERLVERQTGDEPGEGQERKAGDDGHERDQPRDPSHLELERARLGPTALRHRRDTPDLRPHARRDDERARLAPETGRAAEDEVARLDQRACRVVELGCAVDGLGLSRQRGQIDLERSVDEASVDRDAIALVEYHDIARHEAPGLDLQRLSVSNRRRHRREVALERFHGALGLTLLHERERRVEHDDDEDRDAEWRHPRDERKCSRDPEEERERMRDLPCELLRPPRARSALELVRAVLDKTARRLAAGEPAGTRLQVPEEELHGLAGRIAGGSRGDDDLLRHARIVIPRRRQDIGVVADAAPEKY